MSDVLKKRIKKLNDIEKTNGDSVLYIMSRDQRVRDNHALIAAYKHAKNFEKPLIVCFNVYPEVKNRIKNIYSWMFEGLQKLEKDLRDLNIPFIVNVGEALESYNEWENKFNPNVIYFDFSPLRGPRKVKKDFATKSHTPCYLVDTHNLVPVWEASDKQEFAARTIRPKLFDKLKTYLVEPEQIKKIKFADAKFEKNNWDKIQSSVKAESVNNYNPIVKSGEDEACKLLDDFIGNKLENYSHDRNEPSKDGQSNLSVYLHFGQISSLRVLLDISKKKDIPIDKITDHKLSKSLVNEILVWKELAENFCYYNKNYDSLDSVKDWAKETLDDHRKDERKHIYQIEELEAARTHDPAWNAAQNQMKRTGKMHGYMRMYWAKKLLEWTSEPEIAVRHAIYLNDKYELDGYDPNGYAGILWSIGGLHDHGWTERDIFGKIRYMNFNGLKRKFDIEKYIEQWT